MIKFLEELSLNELEERVEFSVCGLSATENSDDDSVNSGGTKGDPIV